MSPLVLIAILIALDPEAIVYKFNHVILNQADAGRVGWIDPPSPSKVK